MSKKSNKDYGAPCRLVQREHIVCYSTLAGARPHPTVRSLPRCGTGCTRCVAGLLAAPTLGHGTVQGKRGGREERKLSPCYTARKSWARGGVSSVVSWATSSELDGPCPRTRGVWDTVPTRRRKGAPCHCLCLRGRGNRSGETSKPSIARLPTLPFDPFPFLM